MLFRFPETKLSTEVYDTLQHKYWESIISYITNSKYRKSIKLSPWILEQVQNPSEELLKAVEEIPSSEDLDILTRNCLMYVHSIITYTGDTVYWDMTERWQDSRETIVLQHGDCEDGAILCYVLCRLKGVPANRLLLCAGDVEGGGHCWLAYKPNGYPLNWVFLDWCYWYDTTSIDLRNKFWIDNNIIYEYLYTGMLVKSNYLNTWFGFNEVTSYAKIRYEINK